MSFPLVSIMIPTYNQEKTIQKAIDSALSQTYPNIEIIISDDSSNKNIEKIIDNFYSNKENIRYIHNIPSKGKTKNYHYILYNLVKGEYVVNLDGDDYFEDNEFITNSVNLIKKYDLVMVIAKQKILKLNENRFIYPQKLPKDFIVKKGKEIFLNSVFKNFEIPHLTTIYNVKIAKKIGFYEYDILSTDRESLLKLCLHGKVGIIDKVVGVWVHHENNISQTFDFEILLNNIKMYDRLYSYARKHSNINGLYLRLWKYLAKYKMLYNYIITTNNKNIIDKINKINNEYKFYSYLLKIDHRLNKRLVS